MTVDCKTFIIGDGSHALDTLHTYLDVLDLETRHKVTVEPYKANRSAAQQGLQWMWNTDIGQHMGVSKDDAHRDMKRRFAVPILTRDDTEYAAMVSAVKAVRKSGMAAQADILRNQIIDMTSTTRFNVTQMAEFLTDVEHFAADIGAPLRFPEDMMKEAKHKC